MKLENQICSLELAKRLKELGVKQDGFYTWFEGEICTGPFNPDLGGCSAFTVSELGEMLPFLILNDGFQYSLQICRSGGCGDYWMMAYRPIQMGRTHLDPVVKTEADDRASMLIYLIEKGLMTP